MVVDDVADMHERIVAGTDLEAGMAVRMTGGGEDGHGVMEQLLAVLRDDELVLEDVKVPTDGLHHVRQRLLIALRLGEIRVRAAPEIILFLQEVDLGVRERRLAVVDETVEVVGMRVAEESGRDLLGLDAQLTQPFGQPAEVRVRVTLAEAGVDQRDFVADAQAHDVHVERQRVQALAVELQRGLHDRPVGLRPHEVEALPEEHVAIADREGLDLADVELVDVRVGRALDRRGLRGIGRGETRGRGQAGQREGGGTEEFTTGRVGKFFGHGVCRT